jgi:hypothetical protein
MVVTQGNKKPLVKVRQGLRRDDGAVWLEAWRFEPSTRNGYFKEYLHVFFIDPKVIAFSVVRLSPRVAARQQDRILRPDVLSRTLAEAGTVVLCASASAVLGISCPWVSPARDETR